MGLDLTRTKLVLITTQCGTTVVNVRGKMGVMSVAPVRQKKILLQNGCKSCFYPTRL